MSRLTLILAVVCLSALHTRAELSIQHLGIYEIISFAGANESQVLTATQEDVNKNSNVFTRPYTGGNNQKWRFFNNPDSSTYSIYPTHNEKLVLDVDSKSLSIMSRLFDTGARHYWVIHYQDEGSVQIINYKLNLCLRNRGLYEQADLTECRNLPETRWFLKRL